MTARALGLAALLAAPPASAQFAYRTFEAGLGSVTAANGVAVADVDGDGDLDVYLVARDAYDPARPTTWNRLFVNRGDGTFTDRTAAAGVAGTAGRGLPNTAGNGAKLGAAWGDYDADGDPDLYLTNAGPNQLLRNDGGTFTDVTGAAGVAGGPTQLSTSALWLDLDGDTDLDLVVGVWEDYAAGPRDLRNAVYENLGDGTFRDVTEASGLGDPGKTYAVLPLDADGDGDLDLYCANDFGANRLWRNDGGTFADATDALGLGDAGEGMGLALGDVDGDGRGDVFLTNRSDAGGQDHALFVARDGGYAQRAVEAGVDRTGWGWGAAFLDLENDGDEDLFVVNGYVAADTPNSLFVNGGAFPLVESAAAWGVDALDAGRGVAVFDADGDGRQDVLVANVGRSPHFYGNAAPAGAWLAVALEGAGKNTDGLGATVEVEAGGRRWVRFHHGAQFLGQNLGPVHVGLGAVEAVDRVTVRWPGGAVDVAEGLAVDQRVRIRQGEGLVDGRGVAREAGPSAPGGLRAWPNPTRGAVRVALDGPAVLDAVVVDALGRTVRRLAARGRAEVAWDGRTEAGERVAPGVYGIVVAAADASRRTAWVTVRP